MKHSNQLQDNEAYCIEKAAEIEQGRLAAEIVRVNEPILSLDDICEFVDAVDAGKE